jgi:ABC-type Fe3+/spermidine/putrescine transport system ATPase subunit
VIATLRPERISVEPEGAPEEALHGGLSGACISRIYAGESSRYEIETGSGTILLRHQNRPGVAGIGIGSRVRVSWQPGDLRVFPASDARRPAEPGDRPA